LFVNKKDFGIVLFTQSRNTNKQKHKQRHSECHNLSPQFILSFWCFIHSYWGTAFRSPQITLQPPASTRAGLSYMGNEWMWQAHARVFTTLNMRSHLTVINLLTILTSVNQMVARGEVVTLWMPLLVFLFVCISWLCKQNNAEIFFIYKQEVYIT
jgi:hypothetical protein